MTSSDNGKTWVRRLFPKSSRRSALEDPAGDAAEQEDSVAYSLRDYSNNDSNDNSSEGAGGNSNSDGSNRNGDSSNNTRKSRSLIAASPPFNPPPLPPWFPYLPWTPELPPFPPSPPPPPSPPLPPSPPPPPPSPPPPPNPPPAPTLPESAITSNQWYSVAYGNGVFVAVAYSGLYKVIPLRSVLDNSPHISTHKPTHPAALKGWTGRGIGC